MVGRTEIGRVAALLADLHSWCACCVRAEYPTCCTRRWRSSCCRRGPSIGASTISSRACPKCAAASPMLVRRRVGASVLLLSSHRPPWRVHLPLVGVGDTAKALSLSLSLSLACLSRSAAQEHTRACGIGVVAGGVAGIVGVAFRSRSLVSIARALTRRVYRQRSTNSTTWCAIKCRRWRSASVIASSSPSCPRPASR